MHPIINYLKRSFEKPENGLTKIVLLHVISFTTLLLLQIFAVFSKQPAAYYQNLLSYFTLHHNWETFLDRPWTLLTYTFVHPFYTLSDFLHFGVHLTLLYQFGSAITRFFGSRRFVLLYLLSSTMAGLTYILLASHIQYLRQLPSPYLVGPSPVIYGSLAALATFAPNFSFFILLHQVASKYIALLFITFSLLHLTDPFHTVEGIGSLAGALWGYLYLQYLQEVSRPPSRSTNPANDTSEKKQDFALEERGALQYVKRFFQKMVTRNPFRSTTHPSRPRGTNPSAEEINLIWTKIEKSGYNSLTKEEKYKLLQQYDE